MTITPQNGDPLAGVAGQYSEQITREGDPLVTGDVPMHGVSGEYTVLTGQELAAYTVVGFNADGKIVPAETGNADSADDVQAIGYLPYAVDTSATGTNADAVGHVIRSGCLNPDILVWDSSFDTDAKKAAAFEGAPSPTQVVLRKVQTLVAS